MYKVKCKIKVSNINQSYNTDLILEKIIWLKPSSIRISCKRAKARFY